jgi:L-fucose isomerase-like protein
MVPFLYVPIASPLHNQGEIDRLLADLRPMLEAAGAIRADDAAFSSPLPLLYLTLTGGTERRLLDLRDGRTAHVPGEPTTILAHPRHNSLPAALETLARVRQLGGRGRIVYLRGGDDPEEPGRIRDAVHDLAVWGSLRRARIGLVGDPSEWLVASTPEPATVRTVWGPEVLRLDVAAVIRQQPSAPAGPSAALASSVVSGARTVVEPDTEGILDASRLHPVLRDLAAAHRLDAITIRCFDLVDSLGTSGCLALAELNDEGVIAGCEGDLVSTVALLWARELLGVLGWMANPARIDERRSVVLLAHCTVPRSMVREYDLRSHFESGRGVGLAGVIPPGDVTLVRIGGTAMDELWVAEGRALPTEHLDGLCRTQCAVELVRGSVTELLESPLGNHLVLLPGRHAQRLSGWWRAMIAPTTTSRTVA